MHFHEDVGACLVDEQNEKIPRTREESLCPCKSRSRYADCCMRFHYGRARAETAEQLMRSRYAAYFFRRVDYLIDTTHPDTKDKHLRKQLEGTIHQANWCDLQIVGTAKGQKDDKIGKVEFIATYFVGEEQHELHELSRFKRYKGMWKYLDGK